MLSQSFLGSRRIETIHNGIDLNIFKPYEESKKKDNIIKLLGVAAVWDARKGLNDFIELRHRLPENYQIKLVGLSNNQIKNLPDGILPFAMISVGYGLQENRFVDRFSAEKIHYETY